MLKHRFELGVTGETPEVSQCEQLYQDDMWLTKATLSALSKAGRKATVRLRYDKGYRRAAVGLLSSGGLLRSYRFAIRTSELQAGPVSPRPGLGI
jgi:hypothetical protein